MDGRQEYVVDRNGTTEFSKVSDALKVASEGDSLVLTAGSYEEKLLLETNGITISRAPGTEPGDVIICGGLLSTAMNVTVRGLTIHQGVDIRAGNAVIEDCEICLGDGLRVCSEANPRIRKCAIHGATHFGDGVYFQEGARGIVEDCEIYENRVNGIHVRGAEPTLLRNKVHDCPYGIYFRQGAKGVCDGNTVENIANFGIYLTGNAAPLVERNVVSHCQVHCLMLSNGAGGVLKDNILNGNVHILKGCSPQMISNAQSEGIMENEILP